MKGWKKAVLLGALALAARTPARAGGPEDDGGGPPRAERKGDLTDEQRAKVKAVFAEGRKARKALDESVRVAVEKLRWQVDAKAGSKEFAATLAEIDKARAAQRDQREKTEQKLAQIFTPEQRARWVLHGPEGRGRGFGGGERPEGFERRGPPGEQRWGRGERGERGDEERMGADGPDDDGGPGDAGGDGPP
jgi:Spy/CpxP family protein refolding chaperone